MHSSTSFKGRAENSFGQYPAFSLLGTLTYPYTTQAALHLQNTQLPSERQIVPEEGVLFPV